MFRCYKTYVIHIKLSAASPKVSMTSRDKSLSPLFKKKKTLHAPHNVSDKIYETVVNQFTVVTAFQKPV